MSISESIMNKVKEAREITFIQPNVALEMSLEAYNTSRKNKLRLEEAHSLFSMALACRSMSKFSDCFNYVLDAYNIFMTYNNDIDIAESLNLLGVVRFYNAMYELALENFLKALYLLDKTDEYLIKSRILNNMGEVYKEIGDFDEALISYNKALLLCEKYNYSNNIAVVLENIGEIHFLKKDYSYSFKCYEKSYQILIENNDITSLAEVENNLGKIYFVLKKFDKARKYYNSALTRLEYIENKFFIIDVLINLAQLEILDNEELFLEYLYKAIKYGEQINARKKLSKLYKLITEFYEKKKDYRRSLVFYKKYHLMEQEIETTVMTYKLEIIKIELSKLFSQEEVKKITKLNTQLEQVIGDKNAQLDTIKKANKRLTVKVISDELTKIPNRRGVNQYILKVWNECKTKPMNVALLMMDIDYFKRYNDSNGHIEGDNCLKKIADCLRNVFGSRCGIIGRFGGEEFVCFIKSEEYRDVLELSELIRGSIEKLQLSYIWNNNEYPVTISIGGIYGLSSEFKSSRNMYLIADEELYKAKNSGRNKVCLKNQNIQ